MSVNDKPTPEQIQEFKETSDPSTLPKTLVWSREDDGQDGARWWFKHKDGTRFALNILTWNDKKAGCDDDMKVWDKRRRYANTTYWDAHQKVKTESPTLSQGSPSAMHLSAPQPPPPQPLPSTQSQPQAAPTSSTPLPRGIAADEGSQSSPMELAQEQLGSEEPEDVDMTDETDSPTGHGSGVNVGSSSGLAAAGLAAASIEPSDAAMQTVWSCPTPEGSYFKPGDPNSDPDSDFTKIVTGAKYWTESERWLVVFNDNFEDSHKPDAVGGMNGAVRPYFFKSPRRAVGISTGWSKEKGGFKQLGVHEKVCCIDLALDKVYLVAREVRATKIIFSCASPYDRQNMGFHIFQPCQEARDYIRDSLLNLQHRGEQRGLHDKTVDDILKQESEISLPSSVSIQFGDWDETARLYQSAVISPDVVVVLLVPHSLAERFEKDTAMICICNMWTPKIQFESLHERHARFFAGMGGELLYHHLYNHPHVSGIILTSLCHMDKDIRDALELMVRAIADRDHAVRPVSLSQLRRERTRFYAQTEFYINSHLGDGQYYGWGPTFEQIDREVNQRLLGLSPPGKRRSMFDERAVQAFAGADSLGESLSAVAANLHLSSSAPPEPNASAPSAFVDLAARTVASEPPSEQHAASNMSMHPAPTADGNTTDEMELDEVGSSTPTSQIPPEMCATDMEVDSAPRNETYRVTAIRDLLAPLLQAGKDLGDTVGPCTLVCKGGTSMQLSVVDPFTLTCQEEANVTHTIHSDIGINEKRLATYHSNLNRYHHLVETQAPLGTDTRLNVAEDTKAIVLRIATATEADEIKFRAVIEGSPFNVACYLPPALRSVGGMGAVVAEFVCAPEAFDTALMELLEPPKLNPLFKKLMRGLFVDQTCIVRLGPVNCYSDPDQKPRAVGSSSAAIGDSSAQPDDGPDDDSLSPTAIPQNKKSHDPRQHLCCKAFYTFDFKNAERLGESRTVQDELCELVLMPKPPTPPPPPPLPQELLDALRRLPVSKDSSGNRIACPPPTEGSGYVLVNADSFEVLPHLPTGSIDLIILDPPSGAYHTSHGGEHWAWDVRWTKEEWERLLPEVWRVLGVGARLIIFGCASEKLVADINEYVTSNAPDGGVAKSLCFWIHNDPTSGVQNSHDPARMTEEVFVFRRAKETIATGTLGNKSGRAKPTEMFYEYKDDEKLEEGGKIKMRMKPINLIRALIRGFERSGTDRSGKETSESGKGVVLDLTMNTCGSGRAALLEGRRFVGVERFSSFAKACEQMELEASVVGASLLSHAGSSSSSGDALVATPPPWTRTRASTSPSESSCQSYFFAKKKPSNGVKLTFESLTTPNGDFPRLLFVTPTSLVAERYFRPSAGYGRYEVSPNESAESLNVIDGLAEFEELKQLQPRLADILWLSGSKWTRKTDPKDDYTIFGELAYAMSLSEQFRDVDGLAFSQDAFAHFHGECIFFERAASRLSFRECGVAPRSGGIWSPPSSEDGGVEGGEDGLDGVSGVSRSLTHTEEPNDDNLPQLNPSTLLEIGPSKLEGAKQGAFFSTSLTSGFFLVQGDLRCDITQEDADAFYDGHEDQYETNLSINPLNTEEVLLLEGDSGRLVKLDAAFWEKCDKEQCKRVFMLADARKCNTQRINDPNFRVGRTVQDYDNEDSCNMKQFTAMRKEEGKWIVSGAAIVLVRPVAAKEEAGVAYGSQYWPELFGSYECVAGDTLSKVCGSCSFVTGEREGVRPVPDEVRSLNPTATEPFADGIWLKLPQKCRRGRHRKKAQSASTPSRGASGSTKPSPPSTGSTRRRSCGLGEDVWKTSRWKCLACSKAGDDRWNPKGAKQCIFMNKATPCRLMFALALKNGKVFVESDAASPGAVSAKEANGGGGGGGQMGSSDAKDGGPVEAPTGDLSAADRLQTDGFVHGGDAKLSDATVDKLSAVIDEYKADPSTSTLGGRHLDRINGEIDILGIVEDDRPLVKSFEESVQEFWNDSWVSVLRPMCKNELTLALAQLHLHNTTEDGVLHVDEERDTVRLWNVVISLYDNPSAGATAVYPPLASEDAVNGGEVSFESVRAAKGNYFITDANTLHFRQKADSEDDALDRQMLVLTFSDGPMPTQITQKEEESMRFLAAALEKLAVVKTQDAQVAIALAEREVEKGKARDFELRLNQADWTHLGEKGYVEVPPEEHGITFDYSEIADWGVIFNGESNREGGRLQGRKGLNRRITKGVKNLEEGVSEFMQRRRWLRTASGAGKKALLVPTEGFGLMTEPGAKGQNRHADSAPRGSFRDAGVPWGDVPKVAWLATQDGTQLDVYPFDEEGVRKLTVKAGTLVIMRGDMGHAGTPSDVKNVRGHVYIDSLLHPRKRDKHRRTLTFYF